MPNKDGKGPKGQGPRDGRGGGRGRGPQQIKQQQKPNGPPKSGGQKGNC